MVLGKSGQLRIVDDQGVEREKYATALGRQAYFENGAEVKKGDRLADGIPSTSPSSRTSRVSSSSRTFIEGRTVQERIDEATGKSTLTVIEFRSSSFRPGISICDENGVCKTKPTPGTRRPTPCLWAPSSWFNDGDVSSRATSSP
jgi:DNA-directed RNA polymerase subunit beta'